MFVWQTNLQYTGRPFPILSHSSAVYVPFIYSIDQRYTSDTPTGKPEAIQMTAPVAQSGSKMQFVMPAKYTALEQLPVPTNAAVTLKYVMSTLCDCHSTAPVLNEETLPRPFPPLLTKNHHLDTGRLGPGA